MKFCPRCKTKKTPEEFYKSRGRYDGLQWLCKLCQTALNIFHYQKRSPEQKLGCVKRFRKWRKNNPDGYKRVLRRGRLKKYGLTEVSFDALLLAQNNKCAICARGLEGKPGARKANIDHCHATGKVRGILCGNCNTALGKFQDSEKVLTSAIEYLRKNK